MGDARLKTTTKTIPFVATMVLVGATATTWASSAHADSKVGNGGDAVVCLTPEGALQSVRLLDFYEGEVFRGITAALTAATDDPTEKAVAALQRLARLDPE